MTDVIVDMQEFDAGAWRTRFIAVANIALLTRTEAVALSLPEPWCAEVDCSWRVVSGQSVYELARVDRDRTYSFLPPLAHIKGNQMQNIKTADTRDARVDPKRLHGPFRLTQLTHFIGFDNDPNYQLQAMVGLMIPSIGRKVKEARLPWTEKGYHLFPPSSKLRGIYGRYAITWVAHTSEMVKLGEWVTTIYRKMTHAGKTWLVGTMA